MDYPKHENIKISAKLAEYLFGPRESLLSSQSEIDDPITQPALLLSAKSSKFSSARRSQTYIFVGTETTWFRRKN